MSQMYIYISKSVDFFALSALFARFPVSYGNECQGIVFFSVRRTGEL